MKNERDKLYLHQILEGVTNSGVSTLCAAKSLDLWNLRTIPELPLP